MGKYEDLKEQYYEELSDYLFEGMNYFRTIEKLTSETYGANIEVILYF